LVQVKTGEVLEGKNVNDPPGVLRGIVPVFDLWLADAAGIPLSLLAETVFWNAWSPDGTTIAYIHRTVDDGIFDNQLWVIQASGSDRKKLLSGARSIAWLDNKTIVFIDSDNEQLHLIDRDGQNVRPLVIEGLAPENSKVVLYALSPDRKKLAFDARGDTKIRIADLAGSQAKLATEIEVPDLSRMSWSPDSKRLAFSHLCSKPQFKPACQQIYIAQPDGTIETQIKHRPDTNVTWSPDGRWITFQETNRVYVADTASGQLQVLYTFPPGKQNTTETIHWSPIGNQIGLNQESDGVAIILSLQN
jgi:Tol biopolymer transport system component